MKNKHLSVLIFLFYCLFSFSVSHSASSLPKPTIAILNFTAPVDEPELVEWGKRYAEFLTIELSKEDWLNVVERIEIDKLLKEMELKPSGLGGVEQSVAIGKMLGAQFLVVGKLQSVEDTINIETDLVEVSTGNVLAKEKLRCRRNELPFQSSKLSSLILREFSKVIHAKETDRKRKTIALLRFKNRSRFKRLNSLEETLPQMLTDDLKLIPGILVLERQHIEKILAEVQLTEFGLIEDATAQRALGADFVISGSFEEKIGGGQPIEESNLEIVVDIRDVAGRTAVKKIEVVGKGRELEKLEKEAVVRIVRVLDIPLSIDKASTGTEKSRLLEAAIHYARGLQILEIQGVEEGLRSRSAAWWQLIREQEQYRAALNEFQKSMYLNPRGSVEIRFIIAACYKGVDDKEKAADKFRQIAVDFPDSKWAAESLLQLHWVYRDQDNINFLEELVAKYPKYACIAYEEIAEFHERHGSYLKAAETYSKYIENFPSKGKGGHARVLVNLADCYLRLDKPQQAAKILEEALEKHYYTSLNDLFHTKLGDIYGDYYKDSTRAIAEYQAARDCRPYHGTCRRLADAYLTLGRWKEAKEAYNQAISYLSPEIWDSKKMVNSYLEKASVCEHLGEWEEALSCYKMIADKYDVTGKVKMCYERLGKDISPLASVDIQEIRYTKERWLAYNNVNALAVDRGGVWVATGAVINYYDKGTNSWKKYGQGDGMSIRRPVTCIVVDEDVVWFGTLGGGVLRYDKIKDKWRNYTAKDGLFGDIVHTIDVDDESVWFGGGSYCLSYSHGWVCRMNKSNGKWYVHIPPTITKWNSDFPCSTIVSLRSDGDYVWVGAKKDEEVFRLHKPTGKWQNLTSLVYRNWAGRFSDEVCSVRTIEINENFVWLGTNKRGLRRYDKSNDRWEFFYASYSASGWGLSGKARNIPGNCELPDNRIHSVAIDDDCVYVAAGGGLCAYSRKDGSWIVIEPVSYDMTDLDSESSFRPSRNKIMTVVVDEDSIWCGTQSNGIIRYLKPHALLAGDERKKSSSD